MADDADIVRSWNRAGWMRDWGGLVGKITMRWGGDQLCDAGNEMSMYKKV